MTEKIVSEEPKFGLEFHLFYSYDKNASEKTNSTWHPLNYVKNLVFDKFNVNDVQGVIYKIYQNGNDLINNNKKISLKLEIDPELNGKIVEVIFINNVKVYKTFFTPGNLNDVLYNDGVILGMYFKGKKYYCYDPK